jgi:hypothetical protein
METLIGNGIIEILPATKLALAASVCLIWVVRTNRDYAAVLAAAVKKWF